MAAAKLIGAEIRHEYVLGYVPNHRDAGAKYRRVSVTVEHPPGAKLTVSHRAGYYARER
jgi:hypothetical protein